ncbi:hypothetical protein EI94DRAFT_1805174 [Lactarius quietus]|nr:hypothetical protein EI94DRAFT_1805174 [Lactarius quietus]
MSWEVVKKHHDTVSLPLEVLAADFQEPKQEIEVCGEREPEIEVHNEPEQEPELHKVSLHLISDSQWFCNQAIVIQVKGPEAIQPTLNTQDPPNISLVDPALDILAGNCQETENQLELTAIEDDVHGINMLMDSGTSELETMALEPPELKQPTNSLHIPGSDDRRDFSATN